MRKEEKRELMTQWFHQNYEDPAENTSYISAEGGYLWNHGGPYDAKEELFDKFGDIVSEALIEEVADDLEFDGVIEWAGGDYYEDDDPSSETSPFDSFSDQRTDAYGSPQDREARDRLRITLRDLLAALDEPKAIGIGHNNPPESIEDTETLEKIRSDANELRLEFGKRYPSISLVKKVGSSLYSAARASAQWTGRKIDLAVDTAIKTIIPAITVTVGASYNTPLHKVLDGIVSWLNIVAHKLI